MRRFATDPLTGADPKKGATEGSAWAGGEQAHLNPETFGNFEHMISKIIFKRIHLSDIVLGAAG
jgi:hypothetical protein